MSTPLDFPDPQPVHFHGNAGAPGAGMPSACVSHGCGGGAPAAPPPPAFGEVRLDGVAIDAEAISREIQHHPAADAEAAWTEAARALVIRALLLREADRLGIEATPEADEAGRVECDEEARIAALLERELDTGGADERACRRYYESASARFRTPDLFEVSHILFEPGDDDEDGWAAAYARADALAGSIGDGPAAFAEAARTLSGCPSAGQDGSLGQVSRGELVPEIAAAIAAAVPGTVTREPVRSAFGWHLVRLARRIEGQILPFEAVHEKIAEMLDARGWTAAALGYVVSLAERASIEGISLEPVVDEGAFR